MKTYLFLNLEILELRFTVHISKVVFIVHKHNL